MQRLIKFLSVLALGLLVFFITREVYRSAEAEEVITSTVLMEEMRTVLKLTTVEGEFSEIYTYRDAQAYFDWMKQFEPFQKKAILRVKAKVSVGYDLEGLDIRLDKTSRVVRLNGQLEPEILSIEHDIDYYDMDEGAFNSFTAADLTRMNADVKTMVRNSIPRTRLFQEAEEQKQAVLQVLRALVEGNGWRFDDGTTNSDARGRLKG